jgi:hypothetical protein
MADKVAEHDVLLPIGDCPNDTEVARRNRAIVVWSGA